MSDHTSGPDGQSPEPYDPFSREGSTATGGGGLPTGPGGGGGTPYGEAGSGPYSSSQQPGYPDPSAHGYAEPSPYGEPGVQPYAQPGTNAPWQQPPAYDQGVPAYGYGQPALDQTGHDVGAYQGVTNYPAYLPAAVQHPQANAALITGVIGMLTSVTCVGGLVGIAGVVLGTQAKHEIDADPARYTGRGKASAGVITGILGLTGTALWVVFFLAVANLLS